MWSEISNLSLALLVFSIATTTQAFVVVGPSHNNQVAAVSSTMTSRSSSTSLYAEDSKPFAVIVQAEIDPDRMHEFLEMIETNAVETRKEPGCIRFDVLRSQDNPSEFFFYELYKNEGAIDYHKQQPHYNLWTKFKESGGTVKSTSFKTDGEFLT